MLMINRKPFTIQNSWI